MNEIKAAWQGKEKLWKVFWIYNFLFGSAVIYAMDYSARLGIVVEVITNLVVLAWIIWVAVSLWRCAFNAKWKIWGYLVRGTIILTAVIAVLALIEPLTGIDPESL